MIRHLVLVRFRPEVTPEDKAALMTALDALRLHLPGMLAFTRLANVSPEHAVVHGFLDGFAVEFADAAARDAYLADAEHRALGARLSAACVGGADGVVVFDHAV